MKKDNTWLVTVGEDTHTVRCDVFKTVFDVYVDGELAARVSRSDADGSDSEYNIKVGGKTCQFVVYDGEPDLAVDGILLGAEEGQRRADLRNKWLKLVGGAVLLVICSYAVFMWIAFRAVGEPISGGILSLFGFLAGLAAGAGLLISALKKKEGC